MPNLDIPDEEFQEDELFNGWSDGTTDKDRDEVIRALLQHLNLRAVRTNRTKHGNLEVRLLGTDDEQDA